MLYTKSNSVRGEWVKASELTNGIKVKLVSETKPIQGEYGEQNVAQAKFNGFEGVKNVRLNKTTINGLVSAFGEESNNWIDKVLIANIEKAIVAGKRQTILYLVPESWELKEDSRGYMEIVNPSAVMAKQEEQGMPQADETDTPF